MPARTGGTGGSSTPKYDPYKGRKNLATVKDPIQGSLPSNQNSPTASRSAYAPDASALGGTGGTDYYSGGGGGYGGGGGFGTAAVAAPAGVVNDITAPFTGFASRYAPGSAEMLFANPEVILRDTLRDQGRVADGGMYYMLQPQAAAANALFMLQSGGTTDPNASNNNAGINFLNQFFRDQSTPGGQAVNFDQGMQALQGYAPGSTLDNLLNQTDPEAQISNYQSLANALANSSLHPLAARAFGNFMDSMGTDFMSSIARNDAQTNFGNYVEKRRGPFDTR